MSGGISPRHAQNPLSGKRRKTLSITHHALSPPPSHHHLYIISSHQLLQRFYRITMSLKRPYVPKSDVKQWFTTTTYCYKVASCVTLLRHCSNVTSFVIMRFKHNVAWNVYTTLRMRGGLKSTRACWPSMLPVQRSWKLFYFVLAS